MTTKTRTEKAKETIARKKKELEGCKPEEPRKEKEHQKYPVIFNEWETSGRQTFRVITDTYKGKILHSIRKYWYDDNDELQPGKGATVDYEDIDEIITGLKKMKVWMEEHPKEE